METHPDLPTRHYIAAIAPVSVAYPACHIIPKYHLLGVSQDELSATFIFGNHQLRFV